MAVRRHHRVRRVRAALAVVVRMAVRRLVIPGVPATRLKAVHRARTGVWTGRCSSTAAAMANCVTTAAGPRLALTRHVRTRSRIKTKATSTAVALRVRLAPLDKLAIKTRTAARTVAMHKACAQQRQRAPMERRTAARRMSIAEERVPRARMGRGAVSGRIANRACAKREFARRPLAATRCPMARKRTSIAAVSCVPRVGSAKCARRRATVCRERASMKYAPRHLVPMVSRMARKRTSIAEVERVRIVRTAAYASAATIANRACAWAVFVKPRRARMA